MDIQLIIGGNVRKLREKRELSQEELASETGLHRTYVSGVERGVRNPTALVIERLAIALEVPPDQLPKAPRK